MNILDIVLIVPTIWFAYKGFRRGLISELFSIAALIVGILACMFFSEAVAGILKATFDWEGHWVGLVSFAVTFIAVVVSIKLLSKVFSKIAEAVALGMVNRLLGLLFGVLKAFLILSALLLVANNANQYYPFLKAETINGSLLYGPVSSVIYILLPLLSENEFWQHSKEILNELLPAAE